MMLPDRTSRFALAACLSIAAALLTGGVAATSAAGPLPLSPPQFASGLVVSSVTGNDSNACRANAPCKTISHAVSVAPSGGQITVWPGTYAEEVTIKKSLKLQARGQVTIDAKGNVNGIVVTGAASLGTLVSGFDVENATGEGILVESTSHVTIRGNHIAHNDTGFNTNATPECAPSGNVPGDCGEGLHLMSVTYSTVMFNKVENNVGGILVTDEMGPSAHNVIAGNVSTNNLEDCGITLPSHNPSAVGNPSAGGVYDNVVAFNVSNHNGGAGVGMFAPFPGAASYDNLVIANRLTNNLEAGVGIHAHAPNQNVSGNKIIGNEVSGNGVDPDSGSGHPTGIALFSAVTPQTVTVSHNHVSNEYWGVFIAGPVTANDLSTNVYAGSVTNATN